MRTSTQSDHDLFRILLYRRDAWELLLETDEEGLQLPVISIPRHTRVAEQITKSIKGEWNLDAYCLFPICEASPRDSSIPFHAVEHCSPDVEAPAGMRWLPIVSLSAADFPDRDDYTGIQAALAKFDQSRRGEFHGAFGKPGWLRTVTEWAEAQAASAGLSLTGKFRQLNASPTFSLLWFETDGPALWFKGVGEPNVCEFSITLSLTKLFPSFVPHVLGWRPDWNAWLAVEAEGMHPRDTRLSQHWKLAATTLANLQIASRGHGLHLIEAGCKDIRACSLLPLVDPFFEHMAEWMKLQTKPTPAPLSRAEIVLLANDVRRCLEKLSGSEIPNVLGHLDFNPGNILVSAGSCVFLDWAEGSVGHPFLTFQYLLEHWRRNSSTDFDSERELFSTYTLPWHTFASPADIDKAFAIMPLLAAFAYAVSSSGWNSQETSHRPVIAGYLRSLARRMKREADTLRERRVACTR